MGELFDLRLQTAPLAYSKIHTARLKTHSQTGCDLKMMKSNFIIFTASRVKPFFEINTSIERLNLPLLRKRN